MKNRLLFFLLSTTLALFSQEAVHNYGTIQIHDGAMVGFHMDLVNDGVFDENSGLVGFYGDDAPLTISGAFNPSFFDTEIAVDQGLFLETTMKVSNNLNLITGNINTQRSNTNNYLNFNQDAFYVGENAVSKIDGYATMENKKTFTFPVGDADRLRPLTITSTAVNQWAKCAYFYEDPNTPTTFAKHFDTDSKSTDYLAVSSKEFWRLEGAVPALVTLSWDKQSNVELLAEFLSDLKVVGWSKAENKWVNLGNTNVAGGMAYGSITSAAFTPDDYEVITIGGNDDLLETYSTVDLGNYFLTPNGDGKNDFLVIDGLENSPNNSLQIFNRYGVLVYSKNNYRNEFNGVSNRNLVVARNTGLAAGVYFYIITLNDLRQKHQGYLYLSQ